MFDPNLDKQYQKLHHKYCDWFKYQKWIEIFDNSFFWVFLGLFILFGVTIYLKLGIYILYSLLSILMTVFIWELVPRVIKRKSRKIKPSPDDFVSFFTIDTHKSLNDYFSEREKEKHARNVEFEKECRKKAVGTAKKLLLAIEKNWTIGEFKLGSSVLGKTVFDFKENLKKRLIPNIEEGDPDTLLKKANEILYQFAVFLRYSTSDKTRLEFISKKIQENLPEIQPEKKNILEKIRNFFRNHTLVTHGICISGIVTSSLLVYFMGINLIGISSNDAYNTSINLAGILFVGYLTITFTILVKKREK